MKHKESPFASDFYTINTVKAFNLTAIAYISIREASITSLIASTIE